MFRAAERWVDCKRQLKDARKKFANELPSVKNMHGFTRVYFSSSLIVIAFHTKAHALDVYLHIYKIAHRSAITSAAAEAEAACLIYCLPVNLCVSLNNFRIRDAFVRHVAPVTHPTVVVFMQFVTELKPAHIVLSDSIGLQCLFTLSLLVGLSN